jgi:6-phosphogluconate dehydrogenase
MPLPEVYDSATTSIAGGIMELGMVGLGRMGANMTTRLLAGGHRVVAHDRAAEPLARAKAGGAVPADSLDALVAALAVPRAVWVMVPAGDPTESTVQSLSARLSSDDIIIDGGNSNYQDSLRRGRELAAKGIHFVDCGTSGGIWGLKEGYSMMVGGPEAAVSRLTPIFETLAPARDRGWGRVGPTGAGHFTKMVHNGIEYGLMQAYAEGFEILHRKEEFGLDLAQIGRIWQHGSVVRSWLLDLTTAALEENPGMEGIAPWVADSGEGRWTVAEAVDLDVPAPVITLALLARLRSRSEEAYADRLLAAMRGRFGGHAVRTGGTGD